MTRNDFRNLQFGNAFRQDFSMDYLKSYDSQAFLRVDSLLEMKVIINIDCLKNVLK